MNKKSMSKAQLTRIVFKDYGKGHTTGKICLANDISESAFQRILNTDLFKKRKLKKKRIMNQKKIREKIKNNEQGQKVVEKASHQRLSPEGKIIELERKLKSQEKKNKELEKLLEIAKQTLGKF